MFRKTAAALASRVTAAFVAETPKPGITVPELRADLLSKGLTAAEASDIVVRRTITGLRYLQAKGYTYDQALDLGGEIILAIPTRPADEKLYWHIHYDVRMMRFWRPFID